MNADLLIKAILLETRVIRGYERFHPSFNIMNPIGYEMQNVSPEDTKPIGNLSTSAVDTAKQLADREVSLRRSMSRDGRGMELKTTPTARELANQPETDDDVFGSVEEPSDEIEDKPRENQRYFVPAIKSSITKKLLTKTGGYAGAFVRGERGMAVPVTVTSKGKVRPKANTILLGGFTTQKPKRK